MANFNKVILAGNLTRDPQLSYLPSGLPVCEFGMAINRKWKDKQTGEMREETCFVDCSAFGRQAETLNQYMGKGRPLLLEGRLKFHQWESKEGQKRSKLSVVADTFQFLGGPPGGGGGGGAPRSQSSTAGAPAREDSRPPIDDVSQDGDDIPF
ncbi:MAG: single-stranded DNA-binding protein [Planctomycetota bacterium]